ncbi:MAG: stage II sporulation protein M [Firmicutes bacterium]|nr:stage II sporulation protein M [Bacillota bacterium]
MEKKFTNRNPIPLNRKAALLALFLFLTGLSLGSFLEMELAAEVRDDLWRFLHLPGGSAASSLTLLLHSLGRNLPLFLLTAAAPLTVIGFPASLLVLLFKGVSLGFSAALLFQSAGFHGLFLTVTSLVPQNLLLLPCFYTAAVLAIQFFLCLFGSADSLGSCLKLHSLPFLKKQLRLLPFLLLGCLLEALTGPIQLPL